MQHSSETHRQYDLPDRPWLLHQTWENVLFAHWPVKKDVLEPYIPRGLQLDTYHDSAWISLLSFFVDDLHPRAMVPFPGIRAFPEVNLRTYVTRFDRPGVWFFSLDAGNALAVALARRFFRLPYYRAKVHFERANGRTRVSLTRCHRKQPPYQLDVDYKAASSVFESQKGSLTSWLTDRYCLFTTARGRLYRGDIHHRPWALQEAEAIFRTNTLASSLCGSHLTAPRLHYSQQQHVHIWPLVIDE
ncbi:YqjF family protein [Alicyclobacillus acidoterrestris]|uniref:DUF2071 domain-containing protein n=1 Tax=Alicyclobacillus acidoterrestris (strain ATCC 49025 / DSM 3922 / CIP 106132 / NCIMB 13137 / GD3B) TaxID=1356854 RepID=T0CVU2_ALIAG|nr:DUF2071 domain-containing protein [Alicyclobacillus acidoterrestris]EPZ43507.1 hypothetical protein N007_12425 [Alicyclobacillus acidoterrestris ATCC 49025]UNO50188.1 DUF2071 domain-containing protein [Alicyclobacillus acidoterrestris]